MRSEKCPSTFCIVILNLSYHILAAYVLDLTIGDPHKFPHPVRAMGWMIVRSERLLRRSVPNLRVAGVLLVVWMVLFAGAGTWGLLWLAGRWHPAWSVVLSIGLLWTGFATKSLYRESAHVLRALRQDDVGLARRKLSMIVGRDTEHLDEPEIVRAALETIGENLCDGVIAPLVYAAIGGAPLLMAYKAVSTLDSMVGHRNERYEKFGWASARMDDCVNFVPARLTGVLICGTAFLLRLDGRRAWHIFRRDRLKHRSPNSAHGESAMAGALGVQLGGQSTYAGEPSLTPLLGDPINALHAGPIASAHRLLFVTSALGMMILLGFRLAIRLVIDDW